MHVVEILTIVAFMIVVGMVATILYLSIREEQRSIQEQRDMDLFDKEVIKELRRRYREEEEV